MTERRDKEETRSAERWKEMWAPLIGLFGPQADVKQPSKNSNPSVTSLAQLNLERIDRPARGTRRGSNEDAPAAL